MNSNGIFRKEVAYDNIKRYKKPEFRPLTRKNIFQLTTATIIKTWLKVFFNIE